MNKMTEARAREIMDGGFHCSQVIIGHFADHMGMDEAKKDELMRMTAGLGGGCNHGDTCGAISAGILALSSIFGFDRYTEEQDNQNKDKIREFQAKFIELHGSVLCRNLLDNYDGADPNRVSTDTTWANCAKYCEDACAILDEMIGTHYQK